MAQELCGIVMSMDAEDEGETTGAHKHGRVLLASTSTAPKGALPDGVRASERKDAMRSKSETSTRVHVARASLLTAQRRLFGNK